MGMIEPAINARIQDMMIVTKPSLSDEESEFDGETLTKGQMEALIEYYKKCKEPRRRVRHTPRLYSRKPYSDISVSKSSFNPSSV